MATIKRFYSRIKHLNSQFGFKGREISRYKSGAKKGQLKITGSGFALEQVYGKTRVVFESKGNTGQRDVSDASKLK